MEYIILINNEVRHIKKWKWKQNILALEMKEKQKKTK